MRSSAKLIGNLAHRVATRVSFFLLFFTFYYRKLILTINEKKLPYKSGKPIEAVEQDPVVKQTG